MYVWYYRFLILIWYGIMFREFTRLFVGLNHGWDGAIRPLSDLWIGLWPSTYYWTDPIFGIPLAIFWIWIIRCMIAVRKEMELDGNK